MPYQTILTELIDNTIGVITLCRPDAANALNQQMGQELLDAIQQAEANPAIRVIILTGEGRKSFCAGADLKERKGMNKEQWHMQHLAFEKARDAILHCKKPIIAAVNGAAYGGGMELAMACDFIYAAKTAKFAFTESKLGIMPGMGGTQFLSRAIGIRRAKEALFLGKIFDADEAYGLGVVNRTAPIDTLMQDVVSVALAISGNAPLSIRAIKAAVDEGMNEPLTSALQTELRYYNSLLDTKDRHEGINAFNEKRKARFTGN